MHSFWLHPQQEAMLLVAFAVTRTADEVESTVFLGDAVRTILHTHTHTYTHTHTHNILYYIYIYIYKPLSLIM